MVELTSYGNKQFILYTYILALLHNVMHVTSNIFY